MIGRREFTLLKTLRNGDTLETLAERTGFPLAEVSRIVDRLEKKGYVRTEREVEEIIEATERGRFYLTNPLPEEKLLDLVKRGVNELKSLKEELGDELVPALGVLKKHGWVKVEKGEVVVLREGEPPWIVEFRSLRKGSYTDELIKRGLIRVRKRKRVRVFKLKDAEEPEYDEEHVTQELIKRGHGRVKPFDVVSSPPPLRGGAFHPYLEFLDRVKEVLVGMGFEEMKWESPIIPHFWNLEVLFVPQDHPAADLGAADTFYLEGKGEIDSDMEKRVKEEHERVWGYTWDPNLARRLVLRSHATTLSAVTLKKARIPGRYFTISRVYRPEQVDAKHLPEFNQLDGIVLGEDLTFRHLLGILKEFGKELRGVDRVKFKAGYFPFTEPSVEMFVKHPSLGWVEVGGAGMFREELLRPFEIEVPVMAWGLGLERFFMTRYGISDIRELFTSDISRLEELPKVWRL